MNWFYVLDYHFDDNVIKFDDDITELDDKVIDLLVSCSPKNVHVKATSGRLFRKTRCFTLIIV